MLGKIAHPKAEHGGRHNRRPQLADMAQFMLGQNAVVFPALGFTYLAGFAVGHPAQKSDHGQNAEFEIQQTQPIGGKLGRCGVHADRKPPGLLPQPNAELDQQT